MKLTRPIRRPLHQRVLLTFGLAFVYVWRKLGLPQGFWSRQVRSIWAAWDDDMFKVLMSSWVKRAYIDQSCTLAPPATLEPKAEVDPQHRLSKDEIASFWKNGWLAPFRAFSEDEIRELGRKVLERRGRDSGVYGFPTDRDWHLDMPEMLEAIPREAIIERCAQLLGPDLLCWRSQLFYKPAGGKAVNWHQASSYMVEDGTEPALLPPKLNELFQLTIWVAVDDATPENGCMRFLPGTFDRICTIEFGGNDAFYKAEYRLEYDIRDEDVVEVPVKAGECIIFTERTIHGSGPNATGSTRNAFNFRLVRPDTVIYRDKYYHKAHHMAEVYLLEKWGAVLMRGEDRRGLNKLANVKGAAV